MKSDMVLEFVEVHDRATFHQLSAAVYELSCAQGKKSDESNTVGRYRGQ